MLFFQRALRAVFHERHDRPAIVRGGEAAYAQYAEEAKAYPHLHLIGRLAEYRYYDMDDAVRRALDMAQELGA